MNNSFGSPRSKRSWTRLPWGTFFLLLAVFFFAQPFDLFYSVRYLNRQEEIENVDVHIEKIKTGSLGRRLGLLALGGFAVVSLFRRPRNRLRINGSLSYLILFFLVWAFLSIAWADDIFLTIRRLVVLGMLCLGALAIAERFSFRDIMHFAFFTGVFTLALGVICEIALSTFQPFQQEYRFGGELNPIYQAYNCGMMTIAALALARTTKRGCPLYLASALVSVLFMLLTKSRGPTFSIVVAVFGYWILVQSKTRKIVYFFVPFIVGPLLYFVLGDDLFTYARVAVLLGRDDPSITTLTGRIPLWQECLKYVAQRPLSGYGYDSFWTLSHVNAVTTAAGFPVPDVHNTFIDLMLGLGIIGLGVYILILVQALRKSINYFKASYSMDYAFACSFLLFSFVNSLLLAVHLHPYIPSFVSMIILAKLGFLERSDLDKRDRTVLSKSSETPLSPRRQTGEMRNVP